MHLHNVSMHVVQVLNWALCMCIRGALPAALDPGIIDLAAHQRNGNNGVCNHY